MPQLGIEDEDTASLDSKRVQNHKSGADSEADGSRRLDIAVLRLPRISNFTDMDPLYEETDVRIRYVSHLDEWGNPDALIIPGSKNTSEDLLFLQKTGLARRIIDHAENGKHVAGICGGYQMLGEALIDPGRIESDHTRLSGLGLLPLETEFISEKQTVRVEGIRVSLLPDRKRLMWEATRFIWAEHGLQGRKSDFSGPYNFAGADGRFVRMAK
ncbi:hypothetical protein [Paenibacillus larvae]|uniref:hypothetical protein n=1 Tax=Paenibacillus larvae TaxID=1464 RepID=UPI001F39A5D7|nr:hypothetical protein [Paenibacillus larvae]